MGKYGLVIGCGGSGNGKMVAGSGVVVAVWVPRME
jgi:hypothetical protein